MSQLKKIYKIIGNKIKENRDKFNKTQQQLADEIGLNRITVVNIENGNQKISLDLLYIIANYFSLSITSFLPLDTEVNEIINNLKEKKFDSWSEKQLNDKEKNEIKNLLDNIKEKKAL